MPTMGLDDATYRQRASAAAKASVILWLLGGFIYNWYHGHLISLSSLLLFLPGIFVAGLVALPVLFIDVFKERILLQQRARARMGQRRASDWLVLVLITGWWVVSQVWPVGLAILAAKLLNRMGM